MGKFSLNNIPILHKLLGTDPNQPNEMQPKEVLAYSTAGFGQNMVCQLVTSFFLFFLTDAVGLNPIWLAVMFLCARLFDAFNDPIMGTIVDRTRSKHGKMRPWLKWMPIPIVILTVLLFVDVTGGFSGSGDAIANMAWATTIYLLWGICYTTVDVPYWGLASSMTSDTDKRNSMLTVARLICMAGAGIVTVLIPVFQGMCRTQVFSNYGINVDKFPTVEAAFQELIAQQGADIEGVARGLLAEKYKITFLIVAIIVAVLALPTFWIGFKYTKERYYEDSAKKASLGHNLKLLGKNKPILMLILVGVLGSLRLIYMTSGLYYAKYCLGNEAMFATMTLLVIPGGLIASLTTPWLSKKFGKRNVFIVSHLIGGAVMTGMYFVGLPNAGSSTASLWMFFITLVIMGVPSGFSNILQYSMIADTIDYLEDKTGERAEGICFSMQTFISKIGMALTAFVCLIVLGAEGYSGAGTIVVDDATKNNIWMMTSLLAGLSTIACTIPLFFYKFTEKEQAKAIARIAERKLAAEGAAGGGVECELTDGPIDGADIDVMLNETDPYNVTDNTAEVNDVKDIDDNDKI